MGRLPLKDGKQIRGMEDFEVKETLGEGSFSVVKLVQEKATRSMFALKIMDKKYLKEEKLEDRLAQ
jgi:serine/threonine protein kinase